MINIFYKHFSGWKSCGGLGTDVGLERAINEVCATREMGYQVRFTLPSPTEIRLAQRLLNAARRGVTYSELMRQLDAGRKKLGIPEVPVK